MKNELLFALGGGQGGAWGLQAGDGARLVDDDGHDEFDLVRNTVMSG